MPEFSGLLPEQDLVWSSCVYSLTSNFNVVNLSDFDLASYWEKERKKENVLTEAEIKYLLNIPLEAADVSPQSPDTTQSIEKSEQLYHMQCCIWHNHLSPTGQKKKRENISPFIFPHLFFITCTVISDQWSLQGARIFEARTPLDTERPWRQKKWRSKHYGNKIKKRFSCVCFFFPSIFLCFHY